MSVPFPIHDTPAAKYQPRKLANSSIPAPRLNAVALLVVYTMYGFDDIDIAALTGLEHAAIKRIRSSVDYNEFLNDITNAVLENEQEDVRQQLAVASKEAARTVISKMNSPNSAIALRAADSVLDRTGHRPADNADRSKSIDLNLNIRYIKADRRDDAIDVEYRDADMA